MNNKKIRSPFCRIGNKYPIINQLLEVIPNHNTYIELFTGSGALFFNKPKVKLNILNDLDKQVINNLELLKKSSSNINDYRQDLTTLIKIKEFYNNHSNSNEDLLLYEKIKSCNGYLCKPVLNEKHIYNNRNPFTIVKKIDIYKDKLKETKLFTKDYEDIINEYNYDDAFFFIDPPYENTDKNFGYAESKIFDYERLLRNIKKIKGFFLLTINNSSYIKKLFEDYNILEIMVRSGFNKGYRKELFIYNYDLH